MNRRDFMKGIALAPFIRLHTKTLTYVQTNGHILVYEGDKLVGGIWHNPNNPRVMFPDTYAWTLNSHDGSILGAGAYTYRFDAMKDFLYAYTHKLTFNKLITVNIPRSYPNKGTILCKS